MAAQLRARADAQFAVDGGDVCLDGPHTDEQRSRGFTAGRPRRDLVGDAAARPRSDRHPTGAPQPAAALARSRRAAAGGPSQPLAPGPAQARRATVRGTSAAARSGRARADCGPVPRAAATIRAPSRPPGRMRRRPPGPRSPRRPGRRSGRRRRSMPDSRAARPLSRSHAEIRCASSRPTRQVHTLRPAGGRAGAAPPGRPSRAGRQAMRPARDAAPWQPDQLARC